MAEQAGAAEVAWQPGETIVLPAPGSGCWIAVECQLGADLADRRYWRTFRDHKGWAWPDPPAGPFDPDGVRGEMLTSLAGLLNQYAERILSFVQRHWVTDDILEAKVDPDGRLFLKVPDGWQEGQG